MKALFDELAESMVPADEPFGVPPNVYINDGYLADGWCKEEDLYFDPCTSGPCSGAGKQKSVVLAERAKRRNFNKLDFLVQSMPAINFHY